ncbi:RNA12 protein-domain-containing protein [Epithele typhae]|uniref:RNA12 protein-domain-containing protein n=1 Tax=Epithele typhae TaxID=378194 RepID=UPI0020074AC1|nr:RNA12 protein-domain-containing protein [Epithele typhae]KAH9946331.1 RNA12 protein-domain-containing protein [Epithele typhae]
MLTRGAISPSRSILARQSTAWTTGRLRHYADSAPVNAAPVNETGRGEMKEGWLWINSVFPVSLGWADVRNFVGYAREETLLEHLHDLLAGVHVHEFRPLALEPQMKDGGVFVKFSYDASGACNSLNDILEKLREHVNSHGGVPSWIGMPSGGIWLVEGQPWREDMNRMSSGIVKVSFDGPDVPEEKLYELFRPYGRIRDITSPLPVPAGTLRSAMIHYRDLRASTSARNTLHGFQVPASSNVTTLRTSYAQPIAPHELRNYIANHPRIFLPILFFLVGTVTYAVFDPIRVLMVEGKMNDWFDYKEFAVYKWLRANTIDRFNGEDQIKSHPKADVWKERQDAEEALQKYLSDLPNTVAFLHGPQGSGKTRMLTALLKETDRKAMVIDVGALSKVGSETALLSGLASQTGYWPIFSFLNSINNMIDLASTGLIGQKAGLSSSLPDQLKEILDVVGRGLSRGNAANRTQRERRATQTELDAIKGKEEELLRERIVEGTWHDGRIDDVCGNGVISELGVGIERFTLADAQPNPQLEAVEQAQDEKDGLRTKEMEKQAADARRKKDRSEDMESVHSLPVVVIKNFESRGGGLRKEELLDALAQWAATLTENQIAHVIVISDNRENVKRLAKALPSKPLNQITLSDADSNSALSFITQKLQDIGIDVSFSKQQITHVSKLGGRASDLESLVYKIRGGMSVEEAVEDIILRGVGELRKSAFGDDLEDAKSLPWSREQVWVLMKQLSKNDEIPYYEVLMDSPFKGDDSPLRHLEHAELITISTLNGRPSTIKPGKPVYKWVFQRLVTDATFQATQDIAYNEKSIASAEAILKACESELLTLKDVDAGTAHWWGSTRVVEMRQHYLLKKMRVAEDKIESLEKQNVQLKKVLAKARR